ncbi:MAG: NADH-quinone oxidoreductase subunit H, partial [Chloroflexi bacterium]|nr:NADH-quinone oxidoreductase subunit H [Chloroflexota bacterium]
MTEFLEGIPQPITYAVGAALIFGFLSVMVLVLTWLERKALARIQQRMGPMRVGPHGTLQPIADALKLMTKEDILPSWADRRVYWLAPLAVFVPSLLLWVTIPMTQDIVLRNMDLGLFYITAFSVLTVLGLVMAGWGSANKYAILGGLRAAGPLVSYEGP